MLLEVEIVINHQVKVVKARMRCGTGPLKTHILLALLPETQGMTAFKHFYDHFNLCSVLFTRDCGE